MALGAQEAAATELARVRREYENSRSWRITRPLRAAARLLRERHLGKQVDRPPTTAAEQTLDGWLEQFFGERLVEIDAACAEGATPDRFALFRDLDDGAWALLLTQQYELYPHIRSLLPAVPPPELQEMWTGLSATALAVQTNAFYTKLRDVYARHGTKPLADASVLDFGCGWGRLTRCLESLGEAKETTWRGAAYLFQPHAAVPEHPQYSGEGRIDYGETIITMPYIGDRWLPLFDLLQANLLLADPYQVMLTLRRN